MKKTSFVMLSTGLRHQKSIHSGFASDVRILFELTINLREGWVWPGKFKCEEIDAFGLFLSSSTNLASFEENRFQSEKHLEGSSKLYGKRKIG